MGKSGKGIDLGRKGNNLLSARETSKQQCPAIRRGSQVEACEEN